MAALYAIWPTVGVLGICPCQHAAKMAENLSMLSRILPVSSPLGPIYRILDVVRLFSRQALKNMRSSKKTGTLGLESMSLETPYCVEVDGRVFATIARVLGITVEDVRGGVGLLCGRDGVCRGRDTQVGRWTESESQSAEFVVERCGRVAFFHADASKPLWCCAYGHRAVSPDHCQGTSMYVCACVCGCGCASAGLD